MYFHPETFLTIDQLGKVDHGYIRTFDFVGSHIDEVQGRYYQDYSLQKFLLEKQLPSGEIIQGWLRPADALKLYEMAYFASADILEIGVYNGLSTSIMAEAIKSSRRNLRIKAIDINQDLIVKAKQNLIELGVHEYVSFRTGDGYKVSHDLISEGKRYGFVFVDHSHSYEDVYKICKLIDRLLVNNGFVMFHDFNDSRNADVNNSEYGVYQAVIDGLDKDNLVFCGIYGCSALYFKK